jgi:cell fate regulator YaaT (PSP1 superfamily)
MGQIVGVKCRKKLHSLDADAGQRELHIGDKVVVETRSGPLLGTVVPRSVCKRCYQDRDMQLAQIVRTAEDADVRQEELNIRMERDYFQVCLNKIKKHSLPMKLVDVEIASDGSKVVFLFVAENRVDFRQLVKELAADLRTRIEMRQIGARSEAQKTGGIGCCGRELCCATFLHKFSPVTVRMTKEQGLPLDPEKISGLCGRLMCCLEYEHETYVELKKGLPKVGKRIMTDKGAGKIRQVNVIAGKFVLEHEDGTIADMAIEQYTPDMLIK